MIVVFIVDLLLDELTQITGIIAHVGILHDRTAGHRCQFLAVLCKGQDIGDISPFQTAFTGEEFQAVSIIGMMAGGDLNRTVTSQFNGCHEHGRRRAKVTVYYQRTDSQQFRFGQFCNMRAGDTGISADRNFQFGSGFAGLFGKPQYKTVHNCLDSFICQVYIEAGTFNGYATNICAAFQNTPEFIQHS